MPAFKFVAELLTKRKFKNLSQTQNEALVDVLTAAKAIDGKLLDVERRELITIVEKLDWKDGVTMDRYIEESIQRATEIEPVPGELDEYFDAIGDRLQDDWLQQEAYYLASRIVLADDEIDENERLLLKHMVQGFEIPSDKQQLIIRKIRSEISV